MYLVVIKKRGDYMKTGRPKIDNPKSKQLTVRLDNSTLEKIDTLAKHYNETRAEVLRRGIEKLYSEK